MQDAPILEGEILDNSEAAITATEQKQIDKAIAEIRKAEVLKINKTDMAIAALQERYMAISITGIADREQYLVALDGHKLVRNHRLAVERKRKEIVEFPNKFLKAVNAEATRIKELLVPIEEHLKLQVGVYEQAEAAEKEKRAQERRTKLQEAGFKFDGHFYVCGMHTISTTQLVDMEEDRVDYYVKEAQAIIAAEKAAEERRQAEIKAQAEAAQKLEAEKQALRKERLEMRAEKLELIGITYANRQFVGKGQNLIATATVADMDATTFNTWFAQMKEFMAEQPAAPVEPAKVEAPQTTIAPPAWTDKPTMSAPPAAPSHLETADLIDEAIAESGKSLEYIDGFEHCRQAVLDLFADGTPRKRAEFINDIKNLKP